MSTTNQTEVQPELGVSGKPWFLGVSDKQFNEIISPKVFHRVILVEGPRHSSKTIGCLHSILWHLWNTPDAVAVVLCRTQADASTAGVWTQLIDTIVRIWENPIDPATHKPCPFGFKIIRKKGERTGNVDAMDVGSHRRYFKTTNRFGGTSICWLVSCNQDTNRFLEQNFKGQKYSYVYVSELTKFENPNLIDYLESLLRAETVKDGVLCPLEYEQMRIVCDTNPDYEKGKKSCWYRKFHWFNELDLDNLDDEALIELGLDQETPERRAESIVDMKAKQKTWHWTKFTLDDNIFLSDDEKKKVRQKWASASPAIRAAYIDGEWVAVADGTTIFGGVFNPLLHIIGDRDTAFHMATRDDLMLPEDGLHGHEKCIELIHGWDLGPKNRAIVIVEQVTYTMPNGQLSCFWKVLDEYVRIDQVESIPELVGNVEEMMDFWEFQTGYELLWQCWSDNSSDFNTRMTTNTEFMEVDQYSGGRIRLQSAVQLKSKGLLEATIEYMRQIIRFNRLLVSAKCENLIAALENFKRWKNGKINRDSEHKHVLDALRYAVCMTSRDFTASRELSGSDKVKAQPARIREVTM